MNWAGVSFVATFRPAAPPFALKHGGNHVHRRRARFIVGGLVLGQEPIVVHAADGFSGVGQPLVEAADMSPSCRGSVSGMVGAAMGSGTPHVSAVVTAFGSAFLALSGALFTAMG
ncbi:hypothetical protein NKH98_31925 [Mesorhizobium sp. M0833]|uniref:hypothetical protein n=1 Tax=Mesorhizobium sp. M0833 TaxID=2957009 RepID=UPI003336559A